MAEIYAPYQNQNDISDQTQFLREITPLSTEAIITPVDFRPNPTHEQIMRRIGEVARLVWQQPENDNLLSFEPLSNTPSSVNFKVFRRGYDNEHTVPHMNGWSGDESRGIYKISYDETNGQFAIGAIHQRNLRYHVSEVEAKKRAGTYDQEMRILRLKLWSHSDE